MGMEPQNADAAIESLEHRRLLAGTVLHTGPVSPGTSVIHFGPVSSGGGAIHAGAGDLGNTLSAATSVIHISPTGSGDTVIQVGAGGSGITVLHAGKGGTFEVASVKISPANERFDKGTLYVTGTDAAERFIPVLKDGKLSFNVETPLAGIVLSQPAATPAAESFANVKKIVINAGGGDDTIDLSSLKIPSEVHGGAGRDIIIGSQANDSLYGDAGNDEISDGKGNDLLAGGSGNDILRAHRGIDTLLGQNGNDLLYAPLKGDILNGGSGDKDVAFIVSIPKSIQGIEEIHRKPR